MSILSILCSWNGGAGALLEYCVLEVDADVVGMPFPNVLGGAAG